MHHWTIFKALIPACWRIFNLVARTLHFDLGVSDYDLTVAIGVAEFVAWAFRAIIRWCKKNRPRA